MLATKIVSDIQNNFCTCHVLPQVVQKEELLTKIYLYIPYVGENQHDTKDVNCSAINGGWSEFENWQSCDETCHKKRGRSCTNPSPAYGGENCTGDDYETQFCSDKGGLHLI